MRQQTFATINEKPRSPNSIGKRSRGTGNSIVRRFTALDAGTRAAINESFL